MTIGPRVTEFFEKQPSYNIYGNATIHVSSCRIRCKLMKLIREEIEQVEVIVEERNGKKILCIEGIFLQGDIKNRNGRMYPSETLAKEVARYNEVFVNKGRAQRSGTS